MTRTRAVGGYLMHFVVKGCQDAVCGYFPARWAAPGERDLQRRNCRECARLYVAARPGDGGVGEP